MAKNRRLNPGDNIYRQCMSIINHVTYLASKSIEFGKKHKIRTITPFKIIQGHRGWYQSKARMQLPISD